ncbi:OLC1v1003944C1 [Oldenlandia corymbosa var. corymbosa]|uniref:OLC1v1003944C1 n=1 Tax=Oldenlandia corymbosa var. corymbosa TaxID=529605 RepID=A0AAV1DBX4_OLDCO|nr:OLC1v1003944C1 [Oldenlandia corymbosa var. corymbosa]
MISVLARERLIGFALGTAVAGVVVFDQRKRIHASIADTYSKLYPQYRASTFSSFVSTHSKNFHSNLFQLKVPIAEKEPGPDFGHMWNKAVDQTFGPVIQSLSSRGW